MDVQGLIESIDIVDLASQFTELEERNGEYWGISPITYPPEKTPSFSVRKETNSFFDFSSGVGGNPLTLVSYVKNISKRDAVDWLLQYSGITGGLDEVRHKLASTTVCRKYAARQKHEKQSKGVVLSDDYMDRYDKHSPKRIVWENEGISKEMLDRFDVRYDSFSDRLVYPIRDISGKIVNVGGRTLDPDWKKKELKKYCYFFGWGTMNTIYGVAENKEEILRKKEIILFEGCKSVLLAGTYGYGNCGALLTSHLSPSQMKILVSLGVRVVFALDNDIDIRNDHNIRKMLPYINIEYIHDTDGVLDAKDSPVDKGKDVFSNLYHKRVTYR